MLIFQNFKNLFTIILIINFRGTFRMEREDGHTFDCRIPPFSLDSKHDPSSLDVNT